MTLLLSIVLGGIFTILIMMSLCGNAMVCAAIFLDRRLRHQHENLFLISLAVSDLLVSVLVMLPAAVNDIQLQWPFGDVYCSLWFSFDIAGCTASILNLCAIAFDRYMHISAAMKYTRTVTRRKIIYIIVLVWCISLTIGFLPRLFTNFSSHHSTISNNDDLSIILLNISDFISPTNIIQNQSLTLTSPTECFLELTPVFTIISSSLSFFIPATVMVIAYGKLYLYARKHVIAMQQQTASQHISRRRITTQTKQKKAMKEHKARITLGVIIGVFLCCWLPFFIVHVIRSLLPDSIPKWSFLTVTWLGYANSTANPVIYTVLNRDFRNAFHKILLHIFPKKHLNKRRYCPPPKKKESATTARPVKFKTFAVADLRPDNSSLGEDITPSCFAPSNTMLASSNTSSPAHRLLTDLKPLKTNKRVGSRLSLHSAETDISIRPRYHTLSMPCTPPIHNRCARASLPVCPSPIPRTRTEANERTALVQKRKILYPYDIMNHSVQKPRHAARYSIPCNVTVRKSLTPSKLRTKTRSSISGTSPIRRENNEISTLLTPPSTSKTRSTTLSMERSEPIQILADGVDLLGLIDDDFDEYLE